ncbi:putative ABC transport system permease protein [Dyadobacter sp. BE34]|uniref:ABC transport system permease protein n=1 Tax=Dyadobacter fermentans TaxID=94254 RepID=A0ABU1R0B7_9BACT|nr:MULTISPECIES: ABC transporter permease [Dyadobacter]MDR6806702.1 putative ABC transport system permease protein [Dyadobacter fermentans]MDR7044444.1 putative ABC transport system permease protein [Dyadobacter sp. BE242]MDR7198754.1 putative ABC transport system permease protein [Dyadobacter sp. BE34]MDR7216716.1 putative ABC transport system permease protein [Dyadobacter sp. BE31]MDR7263758.1 putative ABC transport system permease protein [Dyadobacter sp. BE32]
MSKIGMALVVREMNFNFGPVMIRNHFTIAVRSFFNSKGYSFINVAGLAVGLACTILIFLVVRHETSYDLSQSRLERIYRVETENIKEGHTYPGTYTGMAQALRTDLPEAEVIAPLMQRGGKTMAAGALPAGSYSQEKKNQRPAFRESVVFADNALFRALDYTWVAGNPAHALSQPNAIVLTRAYAKKYFGTADVLGNTIRMDNKQDLTVTGVVEDYPATTSFPFNMLVSFATVKQIDPGFEDNKWNGWNDNFQVFVVLKKGVAPEQLTGRFESVVVKYMGKEALPDKRFKLNHLAEIHYTGNLGGRSANVGLLKTLSVIGALVLLIACFNFINLSTARAFKRAKEVGIRKAIGSSRKSLIYQFLTEAGLVTLFAGIVALVLSVLLLPVLAAALAIPLTLDDDLFTGSTALFTGFLLLLTTLLAGIYPALRLSGMAPIWALKSNSTVRAGQWFSMREGLVVVQFTVSLVLICCAMLIDRQLDFFRNADLGFNKSAVITVGLPDNKPEKLHTLREQLIRSAQIKDVSFSFNSASAESNWMQAMEYRQGPKVVQVKTQMKMGDSHYFDTYGIRMLAGEPLKDSDTTRNFRIIVNEVFLGRIGIDSPRAAIGQRVYYGDGNEFATIVGVVRNFHVNSLHQKIDPTIIQVVPNNFYQAGIKLQSENASAASIQAALADIEKAWMEAFPDQVFEYSFLDETLAQAYQSETRTARLIEAATILAVLIASMGLFGLATFTAEQRTKEIGVRKVLGASVGSVVALLSRDFLKPVVLAIVVASPIAWYLMDQWLQNFEFKISVSWWLFVAAGSLMSLIALATVSFQSLRAAMLDPVRSLRSE